MSPRGHSAAVADGKLRHFSVSQIRDFQRCRRLWASAKLFGMGRPQTKAQATGVDLHGHAEAYYRDGTMPTQEAFLAAIPGLPARHDDLLIEAHLTEPDLFVGETRLEGFSDLIVPPHLNAGIPMIFDWKFVASFRYTEDPADDLQMLTYGYWASKKWPDATEVSVNLIYFSKDSSDFKPRRAVVPVARCEREWQHNVVPTVQAMQALVATLPAGFEAVEPNFADDFSACKKYGGCSFKSLCGVDLQAKQQRAINNTDAQLLAAFDAGIK